MARLQLIAFAALASLLLHCDFSTPGWRGHAGYCPDGEDCSEDTPEGLFFTGARFADCFLFCSGEIKVTAIGGTQTIEVFADEHAQEAFQLPFDAAIEGESFALQTVEPPEVEVSALLPDWSLLRILKSDTEELYDRVPMEAMALDSILPVPSNALELAGLDELQPWLVYAPGASIVVALFSEHGERLVDESMSVALAPATPGELHMDRWDRVQLANLSPGTVTLLVTAGGWAELPIELDAVGGIDAIVPAPEIYEDPADPFPVTRRAIFCFRGLNADLPVVGLDWSFSSPDLELSDGFFASCVSVEAAEPGTTTLTVTAAGTSQTFAVTAFEPEETSARRTPAMEEWARDRAAPGQRARRLQ